MKRGAVSWDDLRVFLEASRQGSVHAAGKRLRLDHSTVCRRIRKLEAALGIKLLDRTRRGIVVRTEAQELLRHIEAMDSHATSLEDVVEHASANVLRAVRIATMEGIASRYVALRLPALEHFDRNVKIELVSIPQMVDLSRKEADIFLSFFDPHLPGLMSQKIAEFALFLFASESYLRKHGVPSSRADLCEHVFVGYIDDLLAIDAVRWLDDVISAPRISFHSNSIIAQCSAALAGTGIVLLPTFVAAGVHGLIRILPEEVDVRREVWLSVSVEQSHLRPIRSVTRFLTHIFERDRDFLMGKEWNVELA